MGITLLTFAGLFSPLQQLAGWLAATPARARSRRRQAHPVRSSPLNCTAGRAHFSWPPAACSSALPLRRPLRVVRIVEACHAPASAGRMFMSGRMADVCAELDRLAALESTQALAPTR
jgi:hypothetical protein